MNRSRSGMLAITMALGATMLPAEEMKMNEASFVVAPHMGGELAVNTKNLVSVFHSPGSADSPSRLRLNLSGGDPKTIDGPDADAVWKALREGTASRRFLWVSHMGGTLGIPIRSIVSVFSTGTGAEQTVRVNYPGDPQGKTVKGAEAGEVWRQLTQ